jgi:hypothetical protein
MPKIASGSEWGCEVLLCAASSNPSWQGIAECRPPMEKLISAMKMPGFSWPTCPEGESGKPDFEAYEDCPAGWSATRPSVIDDRSGSTDPSQCMRTVTTCKPGFNLHGGGDDNGQTIIKDGVTRVYSDDGCAYTEYQDRARRRAPYFFVIEDDASRSKTRYYFDLDH